MKDQGNYNNLKHASFWLLGKIRRRQAIITALACVVVFVTTYALILPAITLDQDEAAEQGGISISTQATEERNDTDVTVQDADSLKPSEALDEDTKSNAETSVNESETQSDVLLFAGKGYEISAQSDGAALPKDTELVAEEILKTDKDYKGLYEDTLQAVKEDSNSKGRDIAFAKFFDISLLSDGASIEPDDPLLITISYDKALKVSDADNLRIVHFAVDEKTDEIKPEVLDAKDVEATVKKDKMTETVFKAESFSVYAVVYTVDFEYDVDGQKYTYSIEGESSISLKALLQELKVIKDDPKTDFNEVELFMSEIKDVVFSSPELVRAEQKKGEWTLTSLKPFSSEEKLTVSMNNGDVFVVRVTDAHEISDSSSTTLDASKSYLICYESGGQYYLLKNDGSVDSSHTPADFENLNSTYCWNFNYVFEEKHLEETMTYVYYLIRPIDNKSKTIALYENGNQLVQESNNNVAVVPTEDGGFHLIGYNEVKLAFENGAFSAKEFPAGNDGIVVHIYEMDTLPTYSYKARSADEERGRVTIVGGTQRTDENGHYYEAESNSDKKNAGRITATPVNHQNSSLNYWDPGYGQNKWQFDYWEQDGIPLDKSQYPATINVNTLPIPFNGSELVAHFKQNPDYVVPDNEKQPSSFEDMSEWLNDLTNKHVPLDEEATKKTAEVYDYENRIYRVDIQSKANFRTFNGNVDMAFCMDVSNSMYFPSKLVEEKSLRIYQINNSYSNKRWLDQSRGWNNPYYLIADQAGTATVFKIYYQGGNWKAQDASRKDESEKSFVIGEEFDTTWTKGINDDRKHPFSAGDNDDSEYMIYNAGDNGRNRFYYLSQSFSGATSDLSVIQETLKVAGAESPQVRVAYNTFNKNLGKQRSDFAPVSSVNVDLAYSADGGTRPDQAFNDAKDNFTWKGNERYVILITDGAPQGKRENENLTPEQIIQAARDSAQSLKNEKNVKIITVGLSLDKVPNGKKLLYDIADNDKNGNKMFFMAESASDLPNILRHITDTIMDEAIVYSDVTDTVGEAFYLVDKETGLPLRPGDMIDINGNKVSDSSQAAGVVQSDGATVTWNKQAIDPTNGWHGTIYVKAKEDLLGGNAVKTNTEANVKATGYKMGSKEFTFNESLIHDKLKSLEISLPVPRVNVNELTFSKESTEWTVYLGAEVDPAKQLKQLYENIEVTEVLNQDGSLHYDLEPNSIVDDRTGGEHGKVATFSLAPEILKAMKADPATAGKYVQNGELNWNAFLTDIQKPGGVVVPYHLYGVEGEDSSIVITLSKEIIGNEETDLVNHSPHKTTELNGTDGEGHSIPVEKYVLTVQFNPDYDHVLPPGQGGKAENPVDYHTGTFGSMYQGHASGRETSTNTHVINVFVKGIRLTKTDEQFGSVLDGAKFKLYCTNGECSTIEEVKAKQISSEELTVTEGHFFTKEEVKRPEAGQYYYVVEEEAPTGYKPLDRPIAVSLNINSKYYPLPEKIETATKPQSGLYNWTDSATLTISGAPAGSQLVDKDGNAIQGSGLTADSESGMVYYKIANNPNVKLPNAGGPGTTWLYLIGLILFVGSGILLVARRRMNHQGLSSK